MDPRELYTLNEAVVAKLKEHRPVLIHQLDGFVDAGRICWTTSSTKCSPNSIMINSTTTAAADQR